MLRRLLLLAALGLCAAARAQFTMAELYTPVTLTNRYGETLPARLWDRRGGSTAPAPLVVMLHGSGECGTDNARQLGLFSAVHRQTLLDDTPALFLVPQCTGMNPWVRTLAFDADYRQPRYPSPALRTVKDAIEKMIADGSVDPDRIYLIGVSLGAFGVWDAVVRWPGFFAAAVPICGGGPSSPEALRKAAQSSIWIFHGAADSNVPVGCARRMAEGLRAIGSPPRYTEYPNAGHSIWGTVLSDPALLRWLFDQRRGSPTCDEEPYSGFFAPVLDRLRSYVTPGS